MEVVILDYGSANYTSLLNFFNKFESINIKVSSKIRDIKKSQLLILPGVGAFDNAVDFIKKKKIDKIIKEHVIKNKPVVGICLGMQILFDSSEETKNNLKGLSILDGRTKKLDQTNIGWKIINSNKNFFKKFNKSYFYFNHNYFQICKKKYIFSSIKIKNKIIPAIIKKGNIIGIQFHPENSQINGVKLMTYILESITNNE